MSQPHLARASFLAGSAAFASIAFVRSPARAAEVTWKLGFVSKAEHPVGVHSIEMAKNVLRESNGRFEIQVFPNSTLINDGDAIQMTRSNAVQMMIPIGSTLSSIVPIAAIEGIGFTFTTQEEALRAFDTELGDAIRREIAATGLHPFKKVWVNGFRQVTTNSRAIKVANDFDGLRLRTAVSKVWIDLFHALGASPTPIEAADLYTALQTHVVDGQEAPFAVIEADHFYDVQKYLSVTNHMWSNFWYVANGDAYKALPNDLRAILDRNIDLAADAQRRDMLALATSLQAKLAGRGMIVNTTDPASFRARLGGFYASYHAQFGDPIWKLLEKNVGKLG